MAKNALTNIAARESNTLAATLTKSARRFSADTVSAFRRVLTRERSIIWNGSITYGPLWREE